MTWRELLTASGEVLSRAEIGEAEIDAWQLFSECFSMSRATYFLRRDESIPGAENMDANELFVGEKEDAKEGCGAECPLKRFIGMVRLRGERIPLQQITGHQEFMGLDFMVNEHVLIPRQDTEILVEAVLEALNGVRWWNEPNVGSEIALSCAPSEEVASLRVLDMCAGSGCIGISLERLAKMPISVVAADISDEALRVATENGRRLGCEQYQVVKSDLFEQVEGRFDLIVSNPPYIPTSVIDILDAEVKDHEPRLALDGEEDGLAFYRRIAEEAPRYMSDHGRIYLEIGYDQGESVSRLLCESGFCEVRVIPDLAGLNRVVVAVWKEK